MNLEELRYHSMYKPFDSYPLANCIYDLIQEVYKLQIRISELEVKDKK